MTQQYEYPPAPVREGVFSSLSIRNFRLYFIGHLISMSGVWMQVVGLSWLVWRLTHSGNWLGAVGFSSRFLTFALGLIGGAIADKLYRRNLILVTQVLSMLQAVLLAAFTIIGIISPEIIVGLVLFLGAVHAFDFPARQSFVMDMVGKDQIDNAVALNSTIIHAARVIGPAIAGLLVAYFGEGACFAINAATFLALIIGILLMNRAELHPQPKHDLPMHKAIKEGLSTAWHDKELLRPLLLVAAISFFGMPYYILIPIFVELVYNGGPKTFGFLMASSAVGALIGAYIIAKLSKDNNSKERMSIAAFGFSISLIAFSLVTKLWMGLIIMLFIGLFALITLASSNALLQKLSPDHVRGRIMSLYTMMFFGTVPFGVLIAGYAAENIGAPTTLTIQGSICIFVAIWYRLVSQK